MIYINPPDKTKEEWLEENALRVDGVQWGELNEALIPIVWIDNGAFTAAAVAYEENELNYLMKDCGRPKKVFIVSREKLKAVVESQFHRYIDPQEYKRARVNY